jgi:urease accessory protein
MDMAKQRAIAMVEKIAVGNQALYYLMSWMSPSYPVGAYTYSHGMEFAREAGLLSSRQDTCTWIADILNHGSGRSDCILLASAYGASKSKAAKELKDIAELGLAYCSTQELELETTQQGRAFMRVTNDVTPSPLLKMLNGIWSGAVIYPIAVAVVAAEKEIPLADTLTAYLHGFISNLVSASVRLIPLGQTDGQKIIAALAPDVLALAEYAQTSKIDDLGSAALMVDWCSSQHETQYTRLFRS